MLIINTVDLWSATAKQLLSTVANDDVAAKNRNESRESV